MLRGDFQAGDTVYIDVADEALTFSKEPYEGVTRYPEALDGTVPEDGIEEVGEAEVEDVV